MQKYIRSSVVSINEVLPLIEATSKPKKVLVDGEYVKVGGKKKALINGEYVNVSSIRLNTFAKNGTICSCCGLEASYFAIERDHSQPSYHLNLYGVRDGNEVLFTHDHTLARSLGGKDSTVNTTTMCTECNHEKSIAERNAVERIRKDESQKEKIIHGLSVELGLSFRGYGSVLETSGSQAG
jgi:5-methylcytosine-specific restriction endonuclease McrA